jgi:hypothetical protein
LRGDRLILDAGEFWFELRPLVGEKATYLFYAGPFVIPSDSVTFETGADGRPALVAALTEGNGEAMTYTFAPVAAGTHAP